MFQLRSIFLFLALQWAVGSCYQCQAPDRQCDFVCDCSDCSDEEGCGYNGNDFDCDFEKEGACGWNDPSASGSFRWERLQGGDILSDSGPSSDYTTGTPTGWFMGVSAVQGSSPVNAILVSPEIQQSSPTCRLRVRYFMWDSGLTGLGSAPLWATILHSSQQTVVWRPEPTSVHAWREDTIFLGSVSSPFRIYFHSRRVEGRTGDVAIDQLEFLNCAPPLPLPGNSCPAGLFECKREGCVEQKQVCDGTDDCGDGSDETDCEYRLCDFEQDWCDWDGTSLSDLKWIRTNQMSISTTDPMKGPGRDHSKNSATGNFLYVTVPDSGLQKDWASFQSPFLQPTNSSHPCKMVMYTHQFGPRSGGLTVMVVDHAISPVWKRGGSLGDLWVKAEVEIVNDFPFQILIMAAIRDFSYGGIAIDSILLSPECRVSSENSTLEKFPDPPGEPCTDPEKLCDFHADCSESADEATCGDFSYAGGSSGWTDRSIGSQSWTLFKDEAEEYLYVIQAPGQQFTDAQTRTPLLGPAGPACAMTFDFALIGNPSHIGEVSLRLIDSMLGAGPKLWEYSGKSDSANSESWLQAEVFIGYWKHRFQMAFEARAARLCPCVRIKVKNVRFNNCHAKHFPSSPTGLSCNFEDGLCGWYQDNDDNFDWTEHDGMDHTTGGGRSMAVDFWSPSLRDMSGRLISLPQSPASADHCLSFFYKLHGHNTGTLNVKLLHKDGHERVIWSRTGSDGNVWQEANCLVENQNEDFQLIFEAIRSGFDGRVAIDDVTFVNRPCGMPRKCSFEGSRCGYTSTGSSPWLHLSGQTASGHRPQSDHTLESSHGSYMLADTDGTRLSSGATMVLRSPVRIGVAKTECLNFWYQMGGVNPGSLRVYMNQINGVRVEVFSTSQKSGDEWRLANFNVVINRVDWQLEFEVIGQGGQNSHIAIDDIFLSPHPCDDQGALCTLEKDMCSWSNTQNIQMDELDWELTTQEGERHYLSPHGDHTLKTAQGHFLSLPSSSQTLAMQRAHLMSPHLPPTKGTCLTFWVYKTHPVRRQLSVWRRSNGRLHQLLEVSDAPGVWKRFDVNIVSTEEYQIVFEGIKGRSGLLALDDIAYTVGVNCDHEVTDVAAAKEDNGGIIATVIVVLILAATFIGLAAFYLRNKRFTSSRASNAGFTNEQYDGDLTQNHMAIPPPQNPPTDASNAHENNEVA